jgi:hypothetical protein
MSVVDVTPKGIAANSYCSVSRADQILAQRLHTVAWFKLSTVPDAEGYSLSSSASAGATSVPVANGAGMFTAECLVMFAGDATVYRVTSPLRNAGALKIEPGLSANLANGTAVIRVTANKKEAGVLWATRIFDEMLVYKGTKRTLEQRLRNPRAGLYDADGNAYDYDTIPAPLEIATAEMANYLQQRDILKQPAALGLGVSEVQLGTLRAKIDGNATVDPIPASILTMLSDIGYLSPSADEGSSILPLERT